MRGAAVDEGAAAAFHHEVGSVERRSAKAGVDGMDAVHGPKNMPGQVKSGSQKKPRYYPGPVLSQGTLQRLENTRGAHAGADAHGHHAVLLFATAQAVDQRGGADGAGGTQRVTEGDGAAERVDLGRVET